MELPSELARRLQALLWERLRAEVLQDEPQPFGDAAHAFGVLHSGELHVETSLENLVAEVEGDLVCDGDVLNCQLLVHGNVRIAGWCSRSSIVALGDAELHSAIHSQVVVRGTLRLAVEARMSVLHAFRVEAEQAVLYGGQVVAAETIRLWQLRGAFGAHAPVLSVGLPYVQQLEQEYWKQQLQQVRQQLRTLQGQLEECMALRRYAQAEERLRTLQREHERLQQWLHELEQRYYGVGSRRARIEVRELVPAETIIAIRGNVYQVPSDLVGVRFSSDGMRIVLESLADADTSEGEPTAQ
jgi:hypothetical protein